MSKMDQNGWCTWQPPNGNRKNYGKPSNLGYIFSDTPIHTLNLCHEKNTTYECLKHVGTKMVIPKGSLAFNGKAWQFPDRTQSYRPNLWCLVEVTLFQAAGWNRFPCPWWIPSFLLKDDRKGSILKSVVKED